MISRKLVCDICSKEVALDGEMTLLGGMTGFYEKEVEADDKKEMKSFQYNFDFCPECNKKIVDFYFELGGK